MIARLEVRPGRYHDSVRLMQASKALQGVPGISDALVAMGTELNLSLLGEMGFDLESVGEVGPNDLEERRLVADWLRRPGVVLVACDGTWTQPVGGGATLAQVTDESRRTARHTRRDRQLLQRRKVVAREPVAG